MTSLIRTDDAGLYVKTGGHIYRPILDTELKTGDKVPARSLENRVAKVGSEIWAATAGMAESDIIARQIAAEMWLKKQQKRHVKN